MAKRKRRKKHPLSVDELKKRKLTRRFRLSITNVFINSGFGRIPSRGIEIQVSGRTGELDYVFCQKNILVIVEDTTSQSQSEILEHLRKKREFVEHLKAHRHEFLEAIKVLSVAQAEELWQYDANELRIVFVYCPMRNVDAEQLDRHRDMFRFLSFRHLLYFSTLTKTIRLTARYEIFRFLGIRASDLGFQSGGKGSISYAAMLLPESPSGFPANHKLVSFLAAPQELLQRAYVLRSNGWEDSSHLYQRLLIPGKIKDMRDYLSKEGRVFVNNIIVTLSSSTRLLDNQNKELAPEQLNKINTPVQVVLPDEFGTVGIIDGQHRLLCYHEGIDKADAVIENLRKRQHLLVTGIIYPSGYTASRRSEFEARLFLEINDKQKRVRPDLRQEIQVIVAPCSATAIAKAVVTRLSQTGPLSEVLEQHYFDLGKLKTVSIVSYGLTHVVRIAGEHSLWQCWPQRPNNERLSEKELSEYVEYCVKQLNHLLVAFKLRVEAQGMWTRDQKVSRALTTTTINGLIYCMRLLIENDQVSSQEQYTKAISKLTIDFRPKHFSFKSSNWKSLGERIHQECFK